MTSEAKISLLNDTWLLKKRVGKGTFSELILGKNILFRGGGHQVAIKLQNEGTEAVVVKHEGEVLRGLAGLATVPSYIHQGQHKNREYLIMDLLGGEDMSSLRDRVRATSGARLIPLPAAAYLALQMLTCIRDLHDRGFIHRDIKPANFVRRESNSSQFSIIDFGVAKQFKEKNGQLKRKREVAEFRGTVLYASPFAHKSQDQCPRDDLFSLVLVFIDMVCGKLPWADAYRQSKDKVAASASKTKYLETPDNIINWVVDTVLAAEKAGVKSPGAAQEEGEELVAATPQNFPTLVQNLIRKMLNHLIAMEYESTPDYDFIQESFEKMIPEGHPDVSDPSYSFGGFQWTGGRDNRLPDCVERPSDPRSLQKIIVARARQLGKLVQKARRGGEGQSLSQSQSQSQSQGSLPVMQQELHQLSQFWTELATDFLSMDEESVSKETSDLLLSVLRDAGKFFSIDLTDDFVAHSEDGAVPHWAVSADAYIAFQRTNDRLQDVCVTVSKRAKPVAKLGSSKAMSDNE